MIGAGTMGGGIAMNFLNAGIPVTLVERSQEALDRGVAIIRTNYEATARKGRLTQREVETSGWRCSRRPSSFDALADADLVDRGGVRGAWSSRRSVFAELDTIAKPGAILATNTSYLDVNEIAAATTRPAGGDRHALLQPANVMRLLEIVRGAKTSTSVLATAMAARAAGSARSGSGRRLPRLRRQPHARAAPARGR